jgi:hypothetical protein
MAPFGIVRVCSAIRSIVASRPRDVVVGEARAPAGRRERYERQFWMATRILGISAYYHDSAACLVVDGEIVAAAQEERFTRKKHDASFPRTPSLLSARGGHRAPTLDYVGFYDKPLLKFERLLENYLGVAPTGLKSFLTAMPVWLKDKLFTRDASAKALDGFEGESSSPSTTSRTPRARSIRRRSRARGPHDGRRRRVGDVVVRRRRGQRPRACSPRSTTRTRSACATRRSPTTRASR